MCTIFTHLFLLKKLFSPSGPAIIVSSSDQYMAFKQLTLEKISHKVHCVTIFTHGWLKYSQHKFNRQTYRLLQTA